MKKLKTVDLSYLRGKNDFEKDGTNNYLVFQSLYRSLKELVVLLLVITLVFWKSKGLSD